MMWGEFSSECGASRLLNVGRVVLGQVFFGAIVLGRVVFGASCPVSTLLLPKVGSKASTSYSKSLHIVECYKHCMFRWCIREHTYDISFS